MEMKCPKCGSEFIYESKRKKVNVCEDCGNEFVIEKKIVPQKVFLSYGHDENKEIVQYIYDKLKERGHKPWIDNAKIKYGDDWRNDITKGILESNGFLAFISKHSTRVPGVCLDEISIGVGNYNCRIQSILLEKNIMPPNTICNIQVIDMSDWKDIKNSSSNEEYNEWLNNKLNEIYDVVENERNIEIAGNISSISKVLNPITSSLKLRLILKNELVARKWLIDKIFKKISEKSNKVLVVTGSPGTGKSVLSAYLTNFSPNVIASFFCEWNNSLSYDCKIFLKSIIFQLAIYMEDYQERIVDLIREVDCSNATVDELLQKLLREPLEMLIDGNREDKIILIDALDESVSANYEFLNVVLKLIDYLPSWIKTIITTRSEVSIIEKLQKYEVLNIDDYKENIQTDIKEYVSKRIENELDIQKIINFSNGSFVYAKELIELYKTNNGIVDYEKIPKGLVGIYYTNFERLFGDINIYNNNYRMLFEIILCVKEQLSEEEICDILNINIDKLKQLLRKIHSYIYEMNQGDKKVLQVFHKSFLDWIVSEGAGLYQINVKNGDKIICEYLIRRCDEEDTLSQYLMKYALLHMEKKTYEELDVDVKNKILNKLSVAASVYGNREKEKYYLDLIIDDYKNTYLYYKRSLEYYKKTSGNKLLEIANQAIAFADNIDNEIEKFKLVNSISFAYFYAGFSEKSYNLIKAERKKHNEEFWKIDLNDADYWHAIAVTAHDLDKNLDVINATKKDVEAYKNNKKYYNQYISMVNLMDGYMACGNLKEADDLAVKIFDFIDNRYYIHVDDILKICYANLLQTENRIMESLVYYEEGLKIANDIQDWDYIYGSIWRELAISKFGDISSINALKKYRKMAIDSGYNYLVSLADVFIIISFLLFKDRMNFNNNYSEDIKLYMSEIENISMPGHMLQAKICLDLLDIDYISINIKEIINLISKCDGVKGCSDLIKKYFDKNIDKMTEEEKNKFEIWIKKYVNPIIDYQNKYWATITANLDDSIYLSSEYNCKTCQSKCCYDGVYISSEEESAIKTFVEKYKDQFSDINIPYIVNGDWPGMQSSRKTEKVEKNDYDETYPKHFTKTKCIFELENGECKLQRIATDNQLHPWKVKPKACWAFPIRGVAGDEILPPPTNCDKDPDYIDENYPGYVTFMPCVKVDKNNGVLWYNKYHSEIEYYSYLIHTKQI